ncbi:MAG: bifunctional phosphoribosyl-AMP cyclohydrolase/phosphoribosyl-ATP diphosphatase HisIE [Deinococcus sp.]|nr:bifunctional phosphoribosyl-AMP cyclohydrolase/phosphoribosyl-ATP diphosphatase HisIE [Deinococcus sp.]MCL5964673.1 bifunctional phosphoribosyl-AMP cyclohydrolase/phosphoribosyl-ATP diphosphatase HisIE [Deinococcus sp.]
MKLAEVKFDAQGLVPVVVQDASSGAVLTLAYANHEALQETMDTGYSVFFSRSRGELWRKGETSGNRQKVAEITFDCDLDAVLYRVLPQGPACHTGRESCFHNPVTLSGQTTGIDNPSLGEVLATVYRTIQERIRDLPEGSYVARLHRDGLDRVLKKVGEEAGEVIIAAKNASPSELAWEASDLVFHLLVTLAEKGVHVDDLAKTLWERHRPSTKE